MNGQAALMVMPHPLLALCCGFIGFFWVVPTFWTCFVFGILGVPSSWVSLLQNVLKNNQGVTNFGVSSIWSAITTFWQALMFRPFHCPNGASAILPKWLIPIFFREDPAMIPPVTAPAAAVRNNEYWIFVNGVGTNQKMAQQSQVKLQHIFKRPCWLCYIPTNSIWFDLLYTLVSERMGWRTTEPLLLNALHNAILQAAAGRYERVVLVTHAHGAVVATLQELHDIDPHFSHLVKRFLEVYTFGHGGHSIPQVGAYLEHLVNGRDSVAWLGVLFPYPRFWRNARGEAMQIKGRVCKEPDQWGHLFENALLRATGTKGSVPIQSVAAVSKWPSWYACLSVKVVVVVFVII